MPTDPSDSNPKDPDEALKAQTARLIAEMEELIRRAKLLMQEGHPTLGYTARQMLRKAVQVVGKRDVLARRLNVTEERLDRWLDGRESIPGRNVLALIALLDRLLPARKAPPPPSG